METQMALLLLHGPRKQLCMIPSAGPNTEPMQPCALFYQSYSELSSQEGFMFIALHNRMQPKGIDRL